VQVIARQAEDEFKQRLSHNVVLPVPDGAEIKIRSGVF